MVTNKISNVGFTRIRSYLLTGLVLLLVVFSCLFINLNKPEFFESITHLIHFHFIAFLLLRWVMLITLILLWPYIIQKIGQRYKAKPERITKWKKESLTIGVWLIIFELVVCEKLIPKVIHLIGIF